MELIGRIKKIMELKKINDRFQKREFVLEVDYNSRFPQNIIFEVVQEKCDLLNALNINDEVKVYFKIKGHERLINNEMKYFNNLEVWKIEKFKDVRNIDIEKEQKSNLNYNVLINDNPFEDEK